jgi:hypothetical protein
MLGIPSALTLQQVWSAHALLGLSQCFDAVLQRGKYLEATLPTHDAGQGERHFTFGIVGSYRYHGVFVTQHDFGDPCADHSYAVLAGPDTFDDCYIGIPYVIFDFRVEIVIIPKAVLTNNIRNRDAPDADTRPVKDLGRSCTCGANGTCPNYSDLHDVSS